LVIGDVGWGEEGETLDVIPVRVGEKQGQLQGTLFEFLDQLLAEEADA